MRVSPFLYLSLDMRLKGLHQRNVGLGSQQRKKNLVVAFLDLLKVNQDVVVYLYRAGVL